MKKTVYGLVCLFMVLGLVFTSAPGAVYAAPLVQDPYTPTWVFPGNAGAAFKVVSIDSEAKTAPAWLQLFSDGLNLSQATKICYTFRHGQFNWVPKFLQLKDGVWKTLPTTIEYLDGAEGSPYACAKPTEAGVYALFAYYNGPPKAMVVPQETEFFTVGSWSMTAAPRLAQSSLVGINVSSWRDFSNIVANDVNWDGYPTATRLAWGIEMCWDYGHDCHNNRNSMSISGMAYPQNRDVIVLNGSMGGSKGLEGQCRFAPFVELLDAGGNSLKRIYYLSAYVDYCIS